MHILTGAAALTVIVVNVVVPVGIILYYLYKENTHGH